MVCNLTFSNVQVEKVAIQDSLNTTCYYRNQIKETFEIVSVNPVENVQSTVGTKCKQIMAGDTLCFSCF